MNEEEGRLPVSVSVVAGHMDVPHCDAPPSREDKAFYDALDASEEYNNLTRTEKREEENLRDRHRILGRTVFELFRHLDEAKEKRIELKEIRNEKWKLWDEIKTQSLKGSVKE